MTGDQEPISRNTTRADRIGNVVQTGSVESVQINQHDRRGIIALSVITALLIGTGAYFWATRQADPSAPGPATESDQERVAAVLEVSPKKDCESGWVAPDAGDAPVPYGSPPSGSVLGTGGTVTVTVQGLSGDSVVLHGIDVEVVARHPAVAGVFLPSSCGSDLVPRYFQVDLDAPRPVLAAEGGVTDFPYKVSGADPEQLIITPMIADAAVDWRLRIHWSSGGDKGELVIDDAGTPLRTTATTRARPFCVEQPDSQRWIPRVEGAQC